MFMYLMFVYQKKTFLQDYFVVCIYKVYLQMKTETIMLIKYTVFSKDCAKRREMIQLIKLKEKYPINMFRKLVRFPSV